jgi:hypothetical protein
MPVALPVELQPPLSGVLERLPRTAGEKERAAVYRDERHLEKLCKSTAAVCIVPMIIFAGRNR